MTLDDRKAQPLRQPVVAWHWTGRALCPFCFGAAHRDPERIRKHMLTCIKRPELAMSPTPAAQEAA